MLFFSPLRNKRRLGGRFLAVPALESASCATYLCFSCQSHPQLFSNVLALFVADKGPMWVYMVEVSLASQLVQCKCSLSGAPCSGLQR